MAGDDKQPTTMEMEPDRVPNYKASAERYEKLQQLALDNSNKLTRQRQDLEQKREQASTAVSDAGKAVVEADNAVKVHQRYIDSLQRQHEDLGKQIDAAQAAGDTAKAQQLDEQYGNQQVEIDKAQAQLGTYQGELEARKVTVGEKANELVEVDQQLTDVRGQEGRSDAAMLNFSSAADEYRNASHYNELAAVAAGGDATETRTAVLAEADRVSEQFQHMATSQAETFEKYRQAEASVKTLQDERAIAGRDQAKLQQDVERARQAGHEDEAASIQQELDWRTQRVEALDARIATENANATQLKEQSDFQHQQAQQFRKDADELRKLSNESPDAVRDHYVAKTQQAVEQADKYVPPDSPSAAVAQELDGSGSAAPPDATGGDATDRIDDEVLGTPSPTDGDGTGAGDSDAGTDAGADGGTDSGDATQQPSDPGASLDDLDAPVQPAAQPAADAADAAVATTPQLLDDLEPPAATEPAGPEAAVSTDSVDVGSAPETVGADDVAADDGGVDQPSVEEPAFEAPPQPEPEPEPEPESEPDAAPEFASE